MDFLPRFIYQNTIKRIKSVPNLWSHSQIHIVHDNQRWVVQEISKNLAMAIREEKFAYASTGPHYCFLTKRVLHFNSLLPSDFLSSNKVIMTWYHTTPNDHRLGRLGEIASRIDVLHTTALITKKILTDFGFSEKKIVVLPMGIDLRLFRPCSPETKNSIRTTLNIPSHVFVIGSFQKDGVGWSAGLEPKMIKGPDIFCDVVERLAVSFPIHVLLSGPSRGYVVKKLERAGIGFTHRHPKQYSEMNTLFQACDLYLITSRAEGVPMALLESWATGTPLVSTRVGMVADVAAHGRDVLFANVEDSNTLIENAARLLEDDDLRSNLGMQGLKTVQQYDWRTLIHQYWHKLYDPLLLTLEKIPK